MDFGPEVQRAGRLVLAEEEHAGQRRDAQLADVLAHVELRLHVDLGVRAWLDDEAVRAGGAARIEQGVDRQLLGVGRRALDPEFGEAGEFLAGVERGIDGQAARG